MTLTLDTLTGIEQETPGAPAALLRMRLRQVGAGMASASAEVKDYAEVLLLKLEQRLREECVQGDGAPRAPAYPLPELKSVASQPAVV